MPGLASMPESSPPSPAQRPDGHDVCLDRMQALIGEREYVCTLLAGHDQHTQYGTGTTWVHGPADAALADLDAARQERDEARATLSIVEANFRELEAERDQSEAQAGRLADHIAKLGAQLAEMDQRVDQAELEAHVASEVNRAFRDAQGQQFALLAQEIGRRERAEAERDRMRPVVEAARAWRKALFDGTRRDAVDAEYLTMRAVDTYETQEGTDG